MSEETVIRGAKRSANEDGSLSWRHARWGHQCNAFGCDNGNGYLVVGIEGSPILVHRVIAKAFLPNFSEDLEVDHIDGDKMNNCPSNLRMVTRSQNQRSFRGSLGRTSSSFRGVTKRKNGWSTSVHRGKRSETYIGTFDSEEEAARSWDAVAYANGWSPEALNFNVRDAQNLLLCTLAVANQQ